MKKEYVKEHKGLYYRIPENKEEFETAVLECLELNSEGPLLRIDGVKHTYGIDRLDNGRFELCDLETKRDYWRKEFLSLKDLLSDSANLKQPLSDFIGKIAILPACDF